MAKGDQQGGRPGELREAVQLALTDGVPRRSLVAALVVGTVLTMINQGDLILAGRPPQLWKAALTYLVPYLVATYGAVTYRLRERARSSDGREGG